ncbi:MAG: hypothetical protein IPM98_12370 [Lewinellaceae bacterium]|nr:hypothetical protein [Lewinellaceae bacterium]
MWYLLSDTRARALYAWITGAGVLTVFVFIQSATGKLAAEDLPFAWVWVAVNLLPGLALLWADVLLHRAPSRLLHPAAHRALVWGTWGYMALLLGTFLALGGALLRGGSVVGYFRASWYWLGPAQGIVLAFYALAFYRKQGLFRPDARVITAFAEQKAAAWKDKGQMQRCRCFELVAENRLPEVFDMLKQAFERRHTANHHAAIELSRQYRALQHEHNMSAVAPGEVQLMLNRVAMGVLGLIEEIPE